MDCFFCGLAGVSSVVVDGLAGVSSVVVDGSLPFHFWAYLVMINFLPCLSLVRLKHITR